MSTREIIWLVAIGILIAAVSFLGVKSCTQSNRIKDQAAAIDSLEHPRVTTVVVHDSIVWKDSIVYRPYPVRVTVIDSIPYPAKGTVTWYDSTYRKERISFRYRMRVLGELSELKFSDFTWPVDSVIRTTHVDTCIEKPAAYKPKNHLGADFNLSGPNFKEMPNAQAVFFWSIKDRVKVNAGAQYDFRHQQLMWAGGVGIYFN